MTIQRIHGANGICVVETADEGKTLDLTFFRNRDEATAAITLLLNVLISLGHNPVTLLPDKEAQS